MIWLVLSVSSPFHSLGLDSRWLAWILSVLQLLCKTWFVSVCCFCWNNSGWIHSWSESNSASLVSWFVSEIFPFVRMTTVRLSTRYLFVVSVTWSVLQHCTVSKYELSENVNILTSDHKHWLKFHYRNFESTQISYFLLVLHTPWLRPALSEDG